MKKLRLYNFWSIITFTLFILLTVGCSKTEPPQISHYSKGMEHVEKKDFNAAVEEFNKAITLDPRFADARYQLGLIYLEINDPKSGLEQLAQASNLDKSNIDAAFKAAELLFQAKQFERSTKFLQRALKQDPNYE